MQRVGASWRNHDGAQMGLEGDGGGKGVIWQKTIFYDEPSDSLSTAVIPT